MKQAFAGVEMQSARTAERRGVDERGPEDRVEERFAVARLQQEAARCFDCGIPFCHAGCPLGNLTPEWNDRIHRGHWKEAWDLLDQTHSFPEFTARLCPALCEDACVQAMHESPVPVRSLEFEIVERAFREGWVQPCPPRRRTGRRVAVVGSGPAGLACARQLNRAGHEVTVFERADRLGGFLRYGIPDFKLEKEVLDRRLRLLAQEGVEFRINLQVGRDVSVSDLRRAWDAIVLTLGARRPRDLAIPGRELNGIHGAVEYLTAANRQRTEGSLPKELDARGRRVIVIGGGDTGNDCVETALRQRALTVVNLEILPPPPPTRPAETPWPFPVRTRSAKNREPSAQRVYGVATRAFVGVDGHLRAVRTVEVQWKVTDPGDRPRPVEIPGSEREWCADMAILALGFLGVEPEGVVQDLSLDLTPSGALAAGPDFQTRVPGIFAAGDARRGPSLVVWAIAEGRECARWVDRYLMGESALPSRGDGDLPRI